jgi:hypothetical protein
MLELVFVLKDGRKAQNALCFVRCICIRTYAKISIACVTHVNSLHTDHNTTEGGSRGVSGSLAEIDRELRHHEVRQAMRLYQG